MSKVKDSIENQVIPPQLPMPQGASFLPPMPPKPMTRRARWGQQLMAGKALITNSLPNWFATYAFATYMVALVGVNILFHSHGTEWYFMLFGIAWVAGFFFLSVKYSKEWSVLRIRKSKAFEKKLFQTGFWIRAAYVTFIYFFYLTMTGQPHEFGAADSASYVEVAGDWVIYIDNDSFWPVFREFIEHSFSDTGYPLAITPFIYLFGHDWGIFMILIANALLGGYTSVIVYRLTRRSLSETTARLAAIFCMLHPVLICYAGLTLKEVLMTFLVVLFIDMADRLLRNRKYTFATIVPMVLTGLALFMFRTVLGMIAFIALFFALVMISGRIVSLGKKIILGVILIGILFMAASDTIMNEIREVTSADIQKQQETSLEYRYGEKKDKKGSGNRFAKYAGTAVFAPLIFTIPFPTMVTVIEGQEDMRLIHGGNWMRNIMSGLVILAMVMLLLTGDWRQYTLPVAMLLGYLLMLTFTQFAHSLRFHIPVMPFEMMFAAYAITNLRKKHRVWYLAWCIFTIATCFAWNWFKLAGRGLA